MPYGYRLLTQEQKSQYIHRCPDFLWFYGHPDFPWSRCYNTIPAHSPWFHAAPIDYDPENFDLLEPETQLRKGDEVRQHATGDWVKNHGNSLKAGDFQAARRPKGVSKASESTMGLIEKDVDRILDALINVQETIAKLKKAKTDE